MKYDTKEVWLIKEGRTATRHLSLCCIELEIQEGAMDIREYEM